MFFGYAREEKCLAKFHLDVLSFGVFLIIVAVWIAAWIMAAIGVENVVSLILLSSGVWTVITAGIKTARHEESGAFSTFGWGMLFIVLGGSLYMVNTGMNPLYAVVLVLLLVGALAIVVALRSIRK